MTLGGVLGRNTVFLFVLIGWGALCAEGEQPALDGVYTEIGTFIDRDGKEAAGIMCDYAVLELRGDRFNYWHFSDAVGRRAYPIKGAFARKENIIELKSGKLMSSEKRWVVKTIKGVEGIWPEEELKKWEEGDYPISVPILVKVAEGPVGRKGLRQDLFKFPTVTPLFDRESAKEYWVEQEAKHKGRFGDVPEPLKTLLRARTDRNDGDMLGYRNLVMDQQDELDPDLIKQLVREIGKGVSIVVGPMVLEDIYGPSHLLPDKPAFEENQKSKSQALRALVSSMGEAQNAHALEATLLTFLRTSEIQEMDHRCENGVRVKLSWKGNRKKVSSFEFGESVRDECQKWAEAQLSVIFEKDA